MNQWMVGGQKRKKKIIIAPERGYNAEMRGDSHGNKLCFG